MQKKKLTSSTGRFLKTNNSCFLPHCEDELIPTEWPAVAGRRMLTEDFADDQCFHYPMNAERIVLFVPEMLGKCAALVLSNFQGNEKIHFRTCTVPSRE